MSGCSSTITCSGNHTLCISEDGCVYSLGLSACDSHGFTTSVASPTIIPTLKNIKSISAGRYTTASLDIDGNVFKFGDNNY